MREIVKDPEKTKYDSDAIFGTFRIATHSTHPATAVASRVSVQTKFYSLAFVYFFFLWGAYHQEPFESLFLGLLFVSLESVTEARHSSSVYIT